MKESEQTLRDFWDSIKCTKKHIMGVEGEETEKEAEKTLKK